LTLTKRQEYNC